MRIPIIAPTTAPVTPPIMAVLSLTSSNLRIKKVIIAIVIATMTITKKDFLFIFSCFPQFSKTKIKKYGTSSMFIINKLLIIR